MPINRAVARAVMKALVGQGWSPTEVLSELRRIGYTYESRLMREDVRKFSGRMQYQGNIERMRPDSFVPKRWMVETELKEPTKYRVHGQARWYNERTGEEVTSRVSWYDDQYLSKAGWEADFMGQDWKAEYGDQWSALGVDVTAVEHNINYSY